MTGQHPDDVGGAVPDDLKPTAADYQDNPPGRARWRADVAEWNRRHPNDRAEPPPPEPDDDPNTTDWPRIAVCARCGRRVMPDWNLTECGECAADRPGIIWRWANGPHEEEIAGWQNNDYGDAPRRGGYETRTAYEAAVIAWRNDQPETAQ